MRTDTIPTIVVLAGLLLLLGTHAGYAEDAYKITLKSGAEIVVEDYKKTPEGISATYEGGTVVFPHAAVKSVVKVKVAPKKEPAPGPSSPGQPSAPATPPAPPSPASPAPAVQSDKEWKVQEVSRRQDEVNQQITQKESEKKALEQDRNETTARINELREEGRRRAIQYGKNPADRGLDYISPQDRQWIYDNTPRIEQLGQQIQQIDDDLKPLYGQRDDLEKRRRELE
jgi:hypothetical protein